MSVSNPTRMYLLQFIDSELKQHKNILSFHHNQEEENLSFIVEFEETYSSKKVLNSYCSSLKNLLPMKKKQ